VVLRLEGRRSLLLNRHIARLHRRRPPATPNRPQRTDPTG
jgi:hypothetical protein